MRRWMFLTCLALALSPRLHAISDAESAAESVAATVITFEGRCELVDNGHATALALGQLLGPGDAVRTGEDGSLQLALADGSSLALGPNTELTLKELGPGGESSRTTLQLLRGLMNAMVEKLSPSGSFEILSANAVVAVKGTDFEVQADGDDTSVTVNEGVVQLGDSQRRRFEPVLPMHRRRFLMNRMLVEEALAKREINSFHERWARAHLFHAQRHELLRHFKDEDRAARSRWRKALLKRRAAREARQDRRPLRKARKARKAASGR